jgi:uncharacterized protein with HEPN domain
MRRDDTVYLRHILDAAALIAKYTAGFDDSSFARNSLVLDAVVRQLEIIGEAARHVSDPLRSKFRDVPWDLPSAMRNKLIHDYMGVDPAIVWHTATVSLLPFAEQIRAVLRTLEASL